MSTVYFASDIHLGKKTSRTSQEREELICDWLHKVSTDADCIYLVGDLFDYWYEYKHVIPKGFELFKATLLELRRKNIRIEIFTGNHDLWMGDYFAQTLDIPIHRDPLIVEWNRVTLFIGHGDGLGPGDHGYKFIKKIFRNKICQWLFSRVHPNFALSLMMYFSKLSNRRNKGKHPFKNFESEWLVTFAEEHNEKHQEIDLYVFGHRHIPIDYQLSNGASRYINLGDWMEHFTYLKIDDQTAQLKVYGEHQVDIKCNWT